MKTTIAELVEYPLILRGLDVEKRWYRKDVMGSELGVTGSYSMWIRKIEPSV